MKMSKAEAGRLGAIKSLEWTHEQKRIRIEKYNLNPTRCGFCKNPLPYEKRFLTYCNHSCCAKKNNIGVRRHGEAPGKCLQCGNLCVGKYCSRKCHREFEWNLKKSEIIELGYISGGDAQHRRVGKRLLSELYGEKCSICSLREWLGKPILLLVDHVNGKHTDGDLKNLRLVCSNCDATLPTYKNRNGGNGRSKRRMPA